MQYSEVFSEFCVKICGESERKLFKTEHYWRIFSSGCIGANLIAIINDLILHEDINFPGSDASSRVSGDLPKELKFAWAKLHARSGGNYEQAYIDNLKCKRESDLQILIYRELTEEVILMEIPNNVWTKHIPAHANGFTFSFKRPGKWYKDYMKVIYSREMM